MATCSPTFAPDENQKVNERRQTFMTLYIRPANVPQPDPADAAPASAPQAASADEQQPGPSNEPQPGPSNEPLPSLSEFEGFMMDVAEMQGQRLLPTLRALGHTASSSNYRKWQRISRPGVQVNPKIISSRLRVRPILAV
ncbi:hypothetical protein GWK47_002977 [Chionoecetes opilio]|uniref:Uncharacterized protein n=1 Tax=Chionoecetes opilio TaxID=41210 RepID=A0A8J8WEJ2_CHIOP|nr:hypothetical protein GWK47_002977 [Chionoecetes opilio]